ncbi:MAG TPA: hypothetical protein DD385_09430, partial [Marinobacter sp.]|nr:hypothetical protein [Marinobacter sp.]
NLVLTMTGPAASAPSGEQPDAPGTLEVQGSASWSGGLQVEADLVLDRFPWFGLIPGLEPPPVAVNRLEGNVEYNDGNYNADLQAAVRGPQGDAELTAALNGDLEAVRITQLDMTTGAGSLTGDA